MIDTPDEIPFHYLFSALISVTWVSIVGIFYMRTSSAGLFSEKYLHKALRPFWKKSKQLKNILKKYYNRIGTDHFEVDG